MAQIESEQTKERQGKGVEIVLELHEQSSDYKWSPFGHGHAAWSSHVLSVHK